MDRTPRNLTRRRLIGSIGGGTIAAAAGCSQFVGTSCACSPSYEAITPYISEITEDDGGFSGTVSAYNDESYADFEEVTVGLFARNGEMLTTVEVRNVESNSVGRTTFSTRRFPHLVTALVIEDEDDDDRASAAITVYAGYHQDAFEPPEKYEREMYSRTSPAESGHIWYPVAYAKKNRHDADDETELFREMLAQAEAVSRAACFQRSTDWRSVGDSPYGRFSDVSPWTFVELGFYRESPDREHRDPDQVPEAVRRRYRSIDWDDAEGDGDQRWSADEISVSEFEELLVTAEGGIRERPSCDDNGVSCSEPVQDRFCNEGWYVVDYRFEPDDRDSEATFWLYLEWDEVSLEEQRS